MMQTSGEGASECLRRASSYCTSFASAYSLLLTGGICLGVAPVVVKALPLPAEVSAFYRVAFSAPLFIAWTLLYAGETSKAPDLTEGRRRAPIWWLYLLAALFFAADLLAMHVSIRLTNASVATLLTNCAPFFVGVFGLFGLSDRPTRIFWIAFPLALAGTILLMGVSALGQANDTLGNGIALLAALFYAAYLVAVRRLKLRGARSSRVMASVTAGSAVILAPFMWGTEQSILSDGHTLLLLAVLVLVGQVAGQGLVTTALRKLPVTSSSIVLLIQPVVAAPLAWFALGETLSLLQMTGMGLVLGSIALATCTSRTIRNE